MPTDVKKLIQIPIDTITNIVIHWNNGDGFVITIQHIDVVFPTRPIDGYEKWCGL